MRITYIKQHYSTPEMAGGTRTYDLSRLLVELGHEVNLVTSMREPHNNADWFLTTEAGVNVHWLPIAYSNHMGYSERIRKFAAFAYAAARRAACIPADVVFASSTPLTIAFPGVYASRRQKVPLVFEVRDLWPQVPIEVGALRSPIARWTARRLERWAYRHSAAIVALAPGMKKSIIETGYPSDRIGIIPNGPECRGLALEQPKNNGDLRHEFPWLGGGLLLVYAGAFGQVNDLDYMVELAASVATDFPSVQFVALGDGARWKTIQKLAEDKQVLNRNFFLLGKTPKNKVLRWLAAADGVLILYKGPKIVWQDCVSNKLFDAIAVRKPVVSNIRGWGPLICESVGAGLILDGKEPLYHAQTLIRCLNDVSWRTAAEEASEKLAKKFCREKLAGRLSKLLEAVVAKQPELAASIAPDDFGKGPS